MKLNCNRKNLAVLALVAIALYFIIRQVEQARRKEKYGYPLETEGPSSSLKEFMGLPYELKCAPTAEEGGAYYTKALTPGGICGGQKFVNAAMGGYKIVGPDPASLMEN